MTRKRFILAILGAAISAVVSPLTVASAPICTAAGEIRQRFIDRGGAAEIVADPRGVAVVSGAILIGNSSPVTADAYLVVQIAGLALVYPVDKCGQLCGSSPPVVIRGRLAADLVRRLREVGRPELCASSTGC